MPTLPTSMAVSSVCADERRRSPALSPREAATKPETASATSMTRPHHQRLVAAATSPSRRRGTISRQPAGTCPRCSWMTKLNPIQPRMATSMAEVMAQTTIHASRTMGCR